MKFTLICEETDAYYSVVSKKTSEFEHDVLDDIVSEFEYFLKGAGFHFNNILIHSDEYEDVDTEFEDSDEDYKHKPLFYGTPTEEDLSKKEKIVVSSIEPVHFDSIIY
jgi:hypothetical protein